MKKIILTILLLIIPCLLFAQETVRTWKSESGKTIIEAAQELRRSKKYGEAKAQIDLALKLYPQETAYLDEKGIIEDYIKLTGFGDASIPAGRRVNISTSDQLHNALKN